MEENRLSLEAASFSIRDIVHESIQMIALSLEKKGLLLKTDLDPKLPMRVFGDSSRLCQIMVNLLSNSVKFSNKGVISLSGKLKQVEGESCIIQFCVSDQGIGIPLDAQARIFQPFFQADNSVSRKYGGTGIFSFEKLFLIILRFRTQYIEKTCRDDERHIVVRK